MCTHPGYTRCLFGTDFSGLDMLAVQLKALPGLPCTQVFASERWEPAREFIRHNHGGISAAADVRSRTFPSVRLHLYGAGPPCQPWAPGGARHGLDDPLGRADMYFESLRFVRFNRPLVFFLENSNLLISYQGGVFARAVCAMARQWGYRVVARVVHTHAYGLPHHRCRTYIVGVHADAQGPAFRWPAGIECPAAAGLLCPREAGDVATRMPAGRIPRMAVQRACRLLPGFLKSRSLSSDCDTFVNVHHSEGWTAKGSRPSCLLPSLTFALGHSPKPWLVGRGRHISPREAARFQGLVPEHWRWPPNDGHCFALLGNTMSGNVIARLLVRGLRAINPQWSFPDLWECGEAWRSLCASAADDRPWRPAPGLARWFGGSEPPSRDVVDNQPSCPSGLALAGGLPGDRLARGERTPPEHASSGVSPTAPPVAESRL